MNQPKDFFEYENRFIKYRHVESKLLYGDLNDCQNPRISILMPIFNAPEKYFKIAFDSAMTQDYKDVYEIVVVDNTPFNEEKTKAQEYIEASQAKNVFYYRNTENIGARANWNRCVELARAPYITFLHDDDQLMPYCLSSLIELEFREHYAWIACRYNDIDVDGNIIREKSPKKAILPFFIPREHHRVTKWDLFLFGSGTCEGSLFERDKFIETGGFPLDVIALDNALQMVYTAKYGGGYIEKPLYNRREGIGVTVTKEFWKKGADDYDFLRQCMQKHIKAPNFILNALRRSCYNFSKWYYAYVQGHAVTKDDYKKMVSLKDRIVFQSFRHILEIKRYKFSLTGW